MEVKAGLSKIKASRGTAVYFFLCEAGADGKPVLLLDTKRLAPKETQPILDKAKKKNKSAGRMEMNADGELLVTPAGSFASSLAKNIQIAARNANAMVFNGIIINPAEPEETDKTEDEPEEPVPTPEGKPKAPPPPKQVSPQAAEYSARLKELAPKYLKAVQAHGPTTDEMKSLFNQVHAELKEKKYDVVGKTLDQLEQLVTAANADPKTGGKPTPKGKFVDFQQQRLLYDNARKLAHAELKKLKTAMLEQCAQDPRLPEIRTAVVQFDVAMSKLDDQLLAKLDAALQETSPEKKQKLQQEAGAIARKYVTHVETNDILNAVDDNPFLPIQVHKTLVTALTAVATRLEG